MLPDELIKVADELSQKLRARASKITTIESCTGGLVGAAITSLSGSSGIYPGGYITYSNELKHAMVGVSLETLKDYGAVSSQTAIEMAQGGLKNLGTSYSIAITGIAGPNGGKDEKRVGTVWICIARSSEERDCRHFFFPGDRDQIRTQSAIASLAMATQMLDGRTTTLEHEQERIDG